MPGSDPMKDLYNQLSPGDILKKFGIKNYPAFLDTDILPDPYIKHITREGVAGTDDVIEDGEIVKVGKQAIPEQYEYRVNPAYPIAGGEIARRYAESQPRDELPMDQTGIDFANLEKDLRFEPQAQYRLPSAQGGRIGYAKGTREKAEEAILATPPNVGGIMGDILGLYTQGVPKWLISKLTQGGVRSTLAKKYHQLAKENRFREARQLLSLIHI